MGAHEIVFAAIGHGDTESIPHCLHALFKSGSANSKVIDFMIHRDVPGAIVCAVELCVA